MLAILPKQQRALKTPQQISLKKCLIQCCMLQARVAKILCIETSCEVGNSETSHHGASGRLQRWHRTAVSDAMHHSRISWWIPSWLSWCSARLPPTVTAWPQSPHCAILPPWSPCQVCQHTWVENHELWMPSHKSLHSWIHVNGADRVAYHIALELHVVEAWKLIVRVKPSSQTYTKLFCFVFCS